MAITRAEQQITWDTGANTDSVASSSSVTSDTFTIAQNVIDGSIQLKADNAGTPASGDTVEFYLQATNGDPDGAGADEYATGEQGSLLCVLHTNANDPAISDPVPLPTTSIKGGRIYAVNNASSNTMTVSATLYLTTSA